ncbi:MAG: response regulator transcription factor [Clostridia bacterium]
MNFSVLIVEDEKQIAQILKMELEHEGFSTQVANDGRVGLALAREQAFDIILLDIMLPYINGIDLCKRMRGFTTVPIIILTAKGDVSDKVLALDSGANDYLVKPFAVEELLARMRVLTKKNILNPGFLLTVGNLHMNTQTHQVLSGKLAIELTKKEFDLLEQLLLNKGIVLSRDSLIQKVWGFDYCGASNVVEVTIKNLRAKIEIEQKLIFTIRGYGYVVRELLK